MGRITDFFRKVFGMKGQGKGRVKVDEVVQSVTLTPSDLGTLGAGATKDAVIAVVTNFGTRAPKGTPVIMTTHPLVTGVFVAPNLARVTVGSATAPVDAAFTFEVDAL